MTCWQTNCLHGTDTQNLIMFLGACKKSLYFFAGAGLATPVFVAGTAAGEDF